MYMHAAQTDLYPSRAGHSYIAHCVPGWWDVWLDGVRCWLLYAGGGGGWLICWPGCGNRAPAGDWWGIIPGGWLVGIDGFHRIPTYVHTYINHITCLAKQWYTNLSYSKRPLMFISIYMGHELYRMIERDELDFITTSIEPTLRG